MMCSNITLIKSYNSTFISLQSLIYFIFSFAKVFDYEIIWMDLLSDVTKVQFLYLKGEVKRNCEIEIDIKNATLKYSLLTTNMEKYDFDNEFDIEVGCIKVNLKYRNGE